MPENRYPRETVYLEQVKKSIEKEISEKDHPINFYINSLLSNMYMPLKFLSKEKKELHIKTLKEKELVCFKVLELLESSSKKSFLDKIKKEFNKSNYANNLIEELLEKRNNNLPS